MTLYELIKDGLDRNIVVYDSESSICSKRLLCLMIQSAKKAGIEPTTFYIDDIAIADLMSELAGIEAWPDKNQQTIYGLNISFVEGLDTAHETHEYQSFYTKMGGTFPGMYHFPWMKREKKNLLVLASKDKAILGCY